MKGAIITERHMLDDKFASVRQRRTCGVPSSSKQEHVVLRLVDFTPVFFRKVHPQEPAVDTAGDDARVKEKVGVGSAHLSCM